MLFSKSESELCQKMKLDDNGLIIAGYYHPAIICPVHMIAPLRRPIPAENVINPKDASGMWIVE